MRSIPRLSGDLGAARPLPGLPPDLTQIPAGGCVFRERCPLRMDICEHAIPRLRPIWQEGRTVACHAVVEDGPGTPGGSAG